jgi:hypothetical protein
MDRCLLNAMQHHHARVAISSSSMRGAGSPGVVAAARDFLGKLSLRPFGTSSQPEFQAHLDHATRRLLRALPQKERRWGRARKGLNIFLRDCLYNTYLRRHYKLGLAETFFEVPLDSIIGARLVKTSPKGALPRWGTVRALTEQTSATYQARAAILAAEQRVARVHLDAMWWGAREESEQTGRDAE